MARLPTPFWGALWAFLLSLGLMAYLYGFATPASEIQTGLFDTKGFRELAVGLWVPGEPVPSTRLGQRGALYALLGGGLHLVAPVLLFILQAAAVAGGVAFLMALERDMTGRVRFSWLALFSVSLLLSPSVLMPEALGFLFGAMALYFAVRPAGLGRATLALVLAALLKVAFWPMAIVALLALWIFSPGAHRAALGATLLVAAHLVVVTIHTGQQGISLAAKQNFEERFYPAVAGMKEDGRPWLHRTEAAAEAKAARPALGDKIDYVVSHPRTALSAWAVILWEHHLWEGSGFAQRDNGPAREGPRDILNGASRGLNAVLVVAALAGLVGIFAQMVRLGFRTWPILITPVLILGTAPVTYFQGDRVIFLALLFLLPFAGSIAPKRDDAPDA
ncbi:MAG: hypothetical protein AAF871_17330 [Pseudomonadota bacterium]